MYTCDGKIFGVKKVDKKFKSAGITTDDSKLDRMDYFHQKVITRGEKSDFDAAMLIASYFPQLIS
jgi:hypothetical protein